MYCNCTLTISGISRCKEHQCRQTPKGNLCTDSLHIYLVQTYFHSADKIGHSACKACWGRDRMWLRTQKPMNRFPQEEGGDVWHQACWSLGSMTRNLWDTIFGAKQENCRIKEYNLLAPSRSEIRTVKIPLGSFHISSTLWPHRWTVSARSGALLKPCHTLVGERLFNLDVKCILLYTNLHLVSSQTLRYWHKK